MDWVEEHPSNFSVGQVGWARSPSAGLRGALWDREEAEREFRNQRRWEDEVGLLGLIEWLLANAVRRPDGGVKCR